MGLVYTGGGTRGQGSGGRAFGACGLRRREAGAGRASGYGKAAWPLLAFIPNPQSLLTFLLSMNIRQLPGVAAIAASGALLFAIEPMAAKTLLPAFGGSAGVWVASMMFFQLVLLLGYLYAFCLTRYVSGRVRMAIHFLLLAGSLAVLPVRPVVSAALANPTLAVLATLATSVGPPFFVLSTANPMVQSWCAAPRGMKLPYWLFAVSNLACLAALLAYPLAIEPAAAVSTQLRWWSGAYAAAVVLVALAAVQNHAWAEEAASKPAEAGFEAAVNRPWLWIVLAASPSALWMAVANYLSQEVAPIPFLWVLPLAIYLLSFVLCFGWEGCYKPVVFRWLLPAAWIAIGWRIGWAGTARDLAVDIPVMLTGLAVLCLFCHGELVHAKPVGRRDLGFFYLMVAGGGAAGGIFVGVVAPLVFSTYLELPLAIVSTIFLALILIYGVTARARLIRLGTLGVAAFVVGSSFHAGTTRVAAARNFYGTLEIRDGGEGERAVRMLYSGRTMHGLQFLAASRRRVPGAYYGLESGAGRVLEAVEGANRRVAIVGLGAGTLAVYGRKGDLFRFYEINPAVMESARRNFTFLADSQAAIDVVNGDGRLRLEREPEGSLDLIVLDAFSGDAIPVHLLTREAFRMYFARLRAGCLLAIHITNRYLDLNPVVEALAKATGKEVLRIHSAADAEQQTLAADWAVVGDGNGAMERLRRYADGTAVRSAPMWTDEYSNLFQVWR